MSRPLAIAALAASGLHVAVLVGMERWRGDGRVDAIGAEPIVLALAAAPDDEPLTAAPPIESTPQPATAVDSAVLSPAEPPVIETIDDSDAEPRDLTEAPAQFDQRAEEATSPETEPDQEVTESAEVLTPTLGRTANTQPHASAAVTVEDRADELVEETSVNAVVVHPVVKPPAFVMALLNRTLQQVSQAARPPVPPPARAAAALPRGERLEPVPEHRPKPRYPAIARRRGYEGTVLLLVEVLEDGRVGRVEIADSSGHDVLDRQAQRTVREQWRFRAGSVNGRATARWIEIPIEFRLTE